MKLYRNTQRTAIALMFSFAILVPLYASAQTNSIPLTRQELVSKLIASLLEQIKVLQAQLLAMQNTSSPSAHSATTTTANYGKPYLGTDGNWYYPNAYDPKGSNLKAPVPLSVKKIKVSLLSSANTSQDIGASVVSNSNFPIPVLGFSILGTNDVFHIEQLIVHFKTEDGLQVSDAYIYKSGTVPLMINASIKNDSITFNIPSSTIGNTIATNTPTDYRVVFVIKASPEIVQRVLGSAKGSTLGNIITTVDPKKDIVLKDSFDNLISADAAGLLEQNTTLGFDAR